MPSGSPGPNASHAVRMSLGCLACLPLCSPPHTARPAITLPLPGSLPMPSLLSMPTATAHAWEGADPGLPSPTTTSTSDVLFHRKPSIQSLLCHHFTVITYSSAVQQAFPPLVIAPHVLVESPTSPTLTHAVQEALTWPQTLG